MSLEVMTVLCPKCRSESNRSRSKLVSESMEWNEDGYYVGKPAIFEQDTYRFECSNGHSFEYLCKGPRFRSVSE